MSIVTNYGYYGFTYIQNATPPSDAKEGDTWLHVNNIDVYVRKSQEWVKILQYYYGGVDIEQGLEESGMKMYFYQNTAPIGWTIDSSVDDHITAVKGGSNAYNVDGGNKAGNWSLTISIPNHSHNVSVSGTGWYMADQDYVSGGNPVLGYPGNYTTSSGGSNGSASSTWRPIAAVGIIATKD